MGHDHSHHEHSHHDHSVVLTSLNRAFILSITLNIIFVIVEFCAGFLSHSLSLISDAGHNLADVGSLALSLLAFRLLRVKSNDHYTYGYRKTTVLAALFNAVILLVSVGIIIYEAIHRFMRPEPIPGMTIAIVAGIGIIINSVTALSFLSNKDKDINVKSAYLHLVTDAVVSLGAVIGGIIIYYTNWFWIDSALSIVIAIVILYSTWGLLKGSLRLSLDGVPKNIHLDEIKSTALNMPGVKDFHHVHVWAISTTENALTAHLVLSKETSIEQEQKIKHELKHELEHKNVHHITIETERENEHCGDANCDLKMSNEHTHNH
jgi:cobalt-zinc-cadmium efflux system protein